MSLRTKLLATIGVLYLVALVGIGVYAMRSARDLPGSDGWPETKECIEYGYPGPGSSFWDGQRMPSLSLDALEARWNRFTPEEQLEIGEWYNARCIEDRVVTRASAGYPARTVYERDKITTGVIAATLPAIVALGAALIWTKGQHPGARESADGESVDSPTGLVGNVSDIAKSLNARTGPTASIPAASTPTRDSKIIESLRQLKALHDDGILTDDEYESKRQLLADQL